MAAWSCSPWQRIQSGVAARLCAALDDGAVTLQRDGLSRVLPARFAIVALDEGVEPDERPPASLLDRMAFHVDLTEVSLRDVADGWSVPSDVGDGCSDLRTCRETTKSLPFMSNCWLAVPNSRNP